MCIFRSLEAYMKNSIGHVEAVSYHMKLTFSIMAPDVKKQSKNALCIVSWIYLN